MRVSFVCPNVFDGDAVGNEVLIRGRYFKERGSEIMVFIEEFGIACREIQSLASVSPVSDQDLFSIDNKIFSRHIKKHPFIAYVLKNIKTSPSRLLSSRILASEILSRKVYDERGLATSINFLKSSDIVFFDYAAYSNIMNLIKLPMGGKKVFWYHGVTPPELFEQESDREFSSRGVENVKLARFADVIVAHSNYTKRELISYANVKGEDVHTIHLPPFGGKPRVSSNHIRTMRRLISSKFNLRGCKVLLYVGRISRHKRLDFLISGLKEIKCSIPNLKLLAVGDFQPRPSYLEMRRLKRISKKEGVKKDVVFTGKLSPESLLGCYALCDVYVTASLHEGFCLPVVEAMVFGKPVVGTNCAAIPETVGDAGLTFQQDDVKGFAEQVRNLLLNKEIYNMYASRAIKRARRFTLDRYFVEMKKILEIDENPQTAKNI